MGISLAIALLILLLGMAWGFQKLAETSRFQLFGKLITRVNTREKVLALTYDDGPNSPYTDQLMEVLGRFGVKATFFVIGQQAEQATQTIREMQAQGHELGNHSYSHKRLIFTSQSSISAEIDKTDRLLNQFGQKRSILFRAPYGYKRIRLPWILSKLNKTHVLWDVDPRDYQATSAEAIVEPILKQVQPGSIVLLHDGGGDRSLTVEATAQIIPKLRERGYRFATVSELLALRDAEPQPQPVGTASS
jgi:peptidoglycan-N-acetylglucosamine deacetylase